MDKTKVIMEEKFEKELLALVEKAKGFGVSVRVELYDETSCRVDLKGSGVVKRNDRVVIMLLGEDTVETFNTVLEKAEKIIAKQISLLAWQKVSPDLFTRLRAKLN